MSDTRKLKMAAASQTVPALCTLCWGAGCDRCGGEGSTAETVAGAVDPRRCPRRSRVTDACLCLPCAVCGHGPHEGIHGPYYGKPAGSEPVGHQYQESHPYCLLCGEDRPTLHGVCAKCAREQERAILG